MTSRGKFNLKEALVTGAKIITRDGYPARILATDIKNGCFNIAIAAFSPDGTQKLYTVNSNGHVHLTASSGSDVFMARTFKEGWINIYKNNQTGGYVYDTEEMAECAKACLSSSVATIRVEWEE